MGFGRIIQVTMGFLIMADAIYKMIDFTLKRVVGYIRVIGANRRQFDPIFLSRVFMGPDLVIFYRTLVAKNFDRKGIGLNTFKIGGNLTEDTV
jgi:hypothetical protein